MNLIEQHKGFLNGHGMTQDFAKRSNKQASKKSSGAKKNTRQAPRAPTSPWALLLTGAVIGSFITTLGFLTFTNPTLKDTATPAQTANNDSSTKEQPMVFEFIEMLKDQEVEVPDSEPIAARKKKKNRANYIQTGSFKKFSEADALRARLILKGMNTTIESSTNSSGTTWYRVIVGPFTSRSKLHGAISTLANDNIDTLPLSRPLKPKG